jgi:hypothetical protein
MGSKQVEIIHCEGTPDESRLTVEALVQAEPGFFATDTPIYEGDVVEIPDPRGGTDRRLAAAVTVNDLGSESMRHIEVLWGKVPAVRVADVRRLGIEGLHPAVNAAASDLFTDGHYSQVCSLQTENLHFRATRSPRVHDRQPSQFSEWY